MKVLLVVLLSRLIESEIEMNRADEILLATIRAMICTNEEAWAIIAALIVAQEKWTKADTVRFGTISEDVIKGLNWKDE